jgi:hypothetical protein
MTCHRCHGCMGPMGPLGGTSGSGHESCRGVTMYRLWRDHRPGERLESHLRTGPAVCQTTKDASSTDSYGSGRFMAGR